MQNVHMSRYRTPALFSMHASHAGTRMGLRWKSPPPGRLVAPTPALHDWCKLHHFLPLSLFVSHAPTASPCTLHAVQQVRALLTVFHLSNVVLFVHRSHRVDVALLRTLRALHNLKQAAWWAGWWAADRRASIGGAREPGLGSTRTLDLDSECCCEASVGSLCFALLSRCEATS